MVPFPLAQTWTFAWQQQTTQQINMSNIKSFRFDKVDFEQVLNKSGVQYVRIYPALKSIQNPQNPDYSLLVVGVDSNGNDIIDTNPQSSDSGIYDFAFPCPNTCGNSPLLYTPQ
jgi:hypothetical protein